MDDIQLSVQDIIASLTGQVAAKAGEIAVLEAKVQALSRLLVDAAAEASEVADDEPADSDTPAD